MSKTEKDGYYEDDGFVWWLYLEGKQTQSSKIVKEILKDLTGRRGLSHEFDGCDDDIKKEIVDTWLGMVDKLL